MEYYKLHHNTDSKISGTYPQAECINLGNAHSIKFDEFAEPNLKLDFILAKRAKLTDVVSQAAISAHGFLVSSKLKSLLEKFTLLNHKFYEVNFTTNKGNEIYYWLHIIDENLIQCVDFSHSRFYRTEFGFREEDIALTSYNDFLKKKKEFGIMGGIGTDHVHLNADFTKNLDMFLISDLHSDVYISQQLYKMLVSEKIRGIKIEEALDMSFC